MKKIQSITIQESNEESLPDFWMDFPYIASCAELDKYDGATAPWHWHPAVDKALEFPLILILYFVTWSP